MLRTIEIGPWQVGTYWVTFALALTICGTYAFHRLLRLDPRHHLIVQGMLLSVVGGFAGAHLITYLINVWLAAQQGILARLEGISIAWGIIATVAVAAVYCWWQRASLGRALDLVAPAVPLGLAIGRLGCFAAGCCYGNPTDSWLGMYLPDENGVWMVRYPTQLMSAAANLGIFFVLLAAERHGARRVGPNRSWPFNGFLALLFVFFFAIKRLSISPLRAAGSAAVVGPFSLMQLSAMAGLAAAATLILWNLHRTKKEENA
jgi:phosphatidylglycerol:prolipoprotein diacylglycerol transferase